MTSELHPDDAATRRDDRTAGHDDDHGRGRSAERPSDIPAKGWKDVAVRVKDEMQDDHTVLAAAGVAFWAFLALIPALAAFASILGLVTSPSAATRRAEELFGGLPTEAQELLTSQLERMAGSEDAQLTTGLVVSLALALWSASGGMGSLMEGVNIAYDEHDQRNFFVKRGIALALTLGAIVFLAGAAVGLAALPSILESLDLPGSLQLALRIAFWPVLAVAFAIGLSLVYRYGPDRSNARWSWVTWGAAIALVLWIVASLGFRVYTSNFASYNETYGSLGAVVILMLWLFITALVVLVGAQINSELERQTRVDTTEAPRQPAGRRGAVAADTLGRTADG